MEVAKSKKRKLSHINTQPRIESAVINSLKVEKITKTMDKQYTQLSDKISKIEQQLEAHDSLRSTILSQQHEIEELRAHIKYIEDNKQTSSKNFDYFL